MNITNTQKFFFTHSDPVVQILLNTELIPEKLIPDLSDPLLAKNPKVQAMVLFFLVEQGIRTIEEANKFAESVYSIPCHADLKIIFLVIWYGIIVQDITLMNQMKVIHGAIDELVTNETPAEIKAIVNLIQGRHAAYFWNFALNFKLCSNITEEINPRSPLFRKLSMIKAMTYLGHGMGNLVQDLVEKFYLSEPSEFDQIAFSVARFSDQALTGKFDQVPTILETLSKNPNHKFIKVNYLAFEMSSTLIALVTKANHLPLPSPLLLDKSNLNRSWALSTQALAENKPEEALYWARLSLDEITTRIGEPIDFADYTLIRAELAMGNGSGAKRLLLHLRERGTETFIDDFFFARAELLLGNRDIAVAHFAQLKTSIEKYDAKKRFDFEVSLARELSASDLLELGTLLSTKQIEVKINYSTQPKGLEAIISVSPTMENTKNFILKYANLDPPVLITGETGTGKELVAHALHDISKRQDRRFIAINCSSIADALIESEFFGYTPGAFTGAQTAYKGIFLEAGEGTVFLDEIADISHQLQVSLLRVLETGEVRPVGSSSVYNIKCRIVVATNQSLEELVEQGKFRRDLYYRLQRLEISLPPLRERLQDVEQLSRYFFDLDHIDGNKVNLSSDLIKSLKEYNWPGNVRELRNAIQRVRILCSDKLFYDLNDFERCGCVINNTEKIPDDLTSQVLETELNLPIGEKNNTFRRKKKLRELFDEYKDIKVSEAANILGVTPYTASRYMGELAKEGFIEKIIPNTSPNSHYFTKK